MNCPSALGVRMISTVWCGSDLDDQIERLVDNPHIVNAKKGSKMTPICGINRGETLPRYQFGHKILVICTVINTV